MKKINFLFFLLLNSLVFANMLEENIPKTDKRFESFSRALSLLKEKQAKVLVETGTARWGKGNFIGDGGSTYIFAEWCSENKAVLYSVDVDAQALQRAEAGLGLESQPFVIFIHSDSPQFLREFNQAIDFLYLDSFDFDFNDPKPSQGHHLNEIVAAYPHLHDQSIVMIDDCLLPHGGKGKLVIDYLLKRGWKVIYQNYQVILSR